MYGTGPRLSTAVAATLLSCPQRSDTALRGKSIPTVRTAALRPLTGEHALDALQQVERLNQAIGSLRDGDRPLGVLAQRQARNAEVRRLFLHAARIGDCRGRAADERHELYVAERLREMNGTGCAQSLHQPEFFESLARARVHREDDRHARRRSH